jgi:hypothetical protein
MRLLEIASAEEQIALWRLVSDNVWAALQLQQDQEHRAAVDTATRANGTAAKAAQKTPDKPKMKSGKGRGAKNKAMKNVLRSYGRVPKLPRVPVPSTPPKPDAKPATSTDKPGPQTPAPGILAQGSTLVRMSAKPGATGNDQAPGRGQLVTTAQTPVVNNTATGPLPKLPPQPMPTKIAPVGSALGAPNLPPRQTAETPPNSARPMPYRGVSTEKSGSLRRGRPDQRQA